MVWLGLLLGASLLLLALGAFPRLAVAVSLAGLVAAVLAPAVVTLGGPVAFGVDGLSAVVLAAVFLHAAMMPGGRRPMGHGALALGVLAADGVVLVLAFAAACVAARARWRAVLGVAAVLAVAMLLLGPDPRFAAMRAGVPDGLRGTLVLAAGCGAAVLMARAMPGAPGMLAAVYLLARLLLDLCGPVTPGWWGVPVLLLGAAALVDGARRAGTSGDLVQAGAQAQAAALGLALMALGAALLARGTDVLPLAALAAGAALVQVLAVALWGGLFALCGGVAGAAVGGTELSRMGGLLRRVPLTALGMLLALLSLAGVPASAGFAGAWPVVQAVLGAGRVGGLGVSMLAAGAVAALGLGAALLAVAGLRLGGMALLGTPRTAKAAGATEPPPPMRWAIAALAGAVLLAGLCPRLLFAVAQPGARLLSGAAIEGTGWFAVAGVGEAGYAAPIVAALLAVGAAVAAGLGGGRGTPVPSWEGGFAEPGVGRGNAGVLPVHPPDRLGRGGMAVLAVLALALAAALGWAAR